LKLEDRLKQKGLENNVTNSFDKLVDEEKVPLQNSAKPLVTKKENTTIKEKRDIRAGVDTLIDTCSLFLGTLKELIKCII
jgi:hypothetical protein